MGAAECFSFGLRTPLKALVQHPSQAAAPGVGISLVASRPCGSCRGSARLPDCALCWFVCPCCTQPA